MAVKFLMIRFLRKMLLVLNLKNLILHSKGIPLFFDSLLNMLYQSISHSFQNPLTKKIITEIKKKPRDLNITDVRFTYIKPFSPLKLKKKGRIKRKVRRKVIKAN